MTQCVQIIDFRIMIFLFFIVEEVIKKLKCIRSQYSREKQKARLRKMRYGSDDVYTSRWLHYDRLSFLDNYLVAKSSSSAMVSVNIHSTL